MTRLLSTVLVVFLAACLPPKPPTPARPTARPFAVALADEGGHPLSGRVQIVAGTFTATVSATNPADGRVEWGNVPNCPNVVDAVVVTASVDGYTAQPYPPATGDGRYGLPQAACADTPTDIYTARIVFVKNTPPPPVKPPRVTDRAKLLDIRAHFGDLFDAQGRLIYTANLPSLYYRDRATFNDWMRRLAATSTHIVLNIPDSDTATTYNGPGVPPKNVYIQVDLWTRLDQYAEVLDAVLSTRCATGNGCIPTVFMDDGGRDPLPRLRLRWPRFASTLRAAGLLPHIIGVLAFEPVVGDYSSLDVSQALLLAHQLMPEMALGYHGSPGRLVGSSNPLEPSDPWQGGERVFYETNGGQFINVALYQAPPDSADAPFCDVEADACWRNRWRDYVVRIGGGLNGWRQMPIALLESVVYRTIRDQATSAQARDVARGAQQVCQAANVACGYGNGLP